jgi:hypothetical protein
VPIVVRQIVLTCPPCNLFGLTVRPAVAVFLAAIALVQEPLVVALELVVEDDASNPTALAAETFLDALVGAIDVVVMRQLARLSEAGPERLKGLVRAVVAFVSVGFEKISPTVPQDNGAVVRTEWRRTYQALLLEVSLGLASVVTAVVEVAFGDDAEGTDGGEQPALGAVDVVHAIAFSNWPALRAAWQVEVLCEHITRVAV